MPKPGAGCWRVRAGLARNDKCSGRARVAAVEGGRAEGWCDGVRRRGGTARGRGWKTGGTGQKGEQGSRQMTMCCPLPCPFPCAAPASANATCGDATEAIDRPSGRPGEGGGWDRGEMGGAGRGEVVRGALGLAALGSKWREGEAELDRSYRA